MTETRWLEEHETEAWLALVGVMLRLGPALDSQMQRDSRITHFDYQVLAMLSMAEGRRLRMSELAAQVNSSLSRLSHVVKKLESRGWVRRTPCAESKRVTMAELTESGWDVVVAAAPGHVTAVRDLVFEGLTTAQVGQLARIATQIRANIDSSSLRSLAG